MERQLPRCGCLRAAQGSCEWGAPVLLQPEARTARGPDPLLPLDPRSSLGLTSSLSLPSGAHA